MGKKNLQFLARTWNDRIETKHNHRFKIYDNYDSDIGELESTLDENILKVSMDLSKSQREVERDIMKLRYDFNKDSLNRVADYTEKMDTRSRQNTADLVKNAENFYLQYFNQAGLSQFLTESPEYQKEWIKNAQSWITPDMKGSIGASNVRKSAQEYEASKPDLTLTNTQKLKLSQQGVDTNKYVSDLEYRTYVDNNLE